MDALPPQTPLLPDLIEAFLARCTIEGMSPRTIQGYRGALARFLRCLREDGAPLEPDRIRPDHVIAYLARYAGHSPDTRHRYFREVRCFWNWLREAGYTDSDAFRGLRNVRLPHRIVPPLAPAEIARLLGCCDHGTVVGRRNRAILLTLLDTGVRCAEATALDLADCALPEHRLLVRHGKGGAAWCPSPGAAPKPWGRTSPTAGQRGDHSSSPRATGASTMASASGRTESSSCCAGSAGTPRSRASTADARGGFIFALRGRQRADALGSAAIGRLCLQPSLLRPTRSTCVQMILNPCSQPRCDAGAAPSHLRLGFLEHDVPVSGNPIDRNALDYRGSAHAEDLEVRNPLDFKPILMRREDTYVHSIPPTHDRWVAIPGNGRQVEVVVRYGIRDHVALLSLTTGIASEFVDQEVV